MVAEPVPTRDPVCGKILDQRKVKERTTYQGLEFHFCSARHRRLFEQDPMLYIRQGVPLP